MATNWRETMVLAKMLCIPWRWFGWMLVISLCLSALGLALKALGTLSWALFIPAPFLAISFIFIVVFMQGQMLSLGSSKQLYLLGNLRLRMLGISFVCLAVCVLVVTIFVTSLNGLDAAKLFMCMLFVVSALFTLSVFLCKYWNGLQGLIFFFTVFYFRMGDWLFHHPVVISYLGVAAVWAIFSYWFLAWRPTKFHQNILAVTQADSNRQRELMQYSVYNLPNLISGRPRSIAGSLLSGGSDSWVAQIQRSFLEVFIFLFVVSIPYWLAGGEGFGKVLADNAYIYLVFSMSGQMLKLYLSIASNLSKVWLFHAGDRSDLLAEVEKFYFPRVLVSMLPGAVLVVLCNHLFNQVTIGALPLLALFIEVLLVSGLLLYLGINLTSKSAGSLRWSGWIFGGTIIFLIAFSWLTTAFLRPTLPALLGFGIMYALLMVVVLWLRTGLLTLLPVTSFYKVRK